MKLSKSLLYNSVMLVLCAVGLYLNYKACYPGFLSPDSLAQYEEVLSNSYSTWHPPIMAFTWHQLNKISEGPQLMLALQLSFLWIACYLIATSFRNWLWGILVVAVFVFAPFIHNFSGWVVKDTQMTLSWLLAAAIMFKGATGSRRIGWLGAFLVAVLLIYGTWMRYNAVTALPPLCILWAWLAFRYSRTWVKVGAATALLLITVFGHNFFNTVVLKASKDHTDYQIYFHDLAGVYARSGKNYFPPSVLKVPNFDTVYIKSHYNPINVTDLLWNPDGKALLLANAQTTKTMRTAWLNMIRQEPIAYLKLRWHIYQHFLNLKQGEPSQYFYIWISENPYGFKIDPTPLHYKFAGMLYDQEKRIYFQVWFWIFLNVLLFPLVYFVRNRLLKLTYLCIAASGFLYTLPQFVVANTTRDFRYIYWACFACILSLLLLLADRWLMKRRVQTSVPEGS